MVHGDGISKQWMVGVGLPILLFFVLLRGAQGQNACPRTSYETRSRGGSQRYTTSCGLFGWSRCTRYRSTTEYYQAVVTTNECCTGWSKDNSGRCLTALCGNPCQYGSCSSPNVCTCNSGYTGLNCNQAICDPQCQHGTCSSPDVCTCHDGYEGNICNQAVCDISCQHGGVCIAPNNCSCQYSFTGESCNQGVWCADEPKTKMRSHISVGRPLSGACLQNHVVYTFLSRSPIACAFTCRRNSGCKSFNYLANEGRCELNSVGREGSSNGDWVENMDCVFYQP